MQEGVLPDAREHVPRRPGGSSARVRDTPCVRTALWSPPAPPPLWLWLLLLLPRCQQERLLCALGLLPPGIAFLAQVLYLVFAVMEQYHQQVALAFPSRFF